MRSPFRIQVVLMLLGLACVTFLFERAFSQAKAPIPELRIASLTTGTSTLLNHASDSRNRPGFLVEESSHPASDAIDRAKAAEITGRDWDDDRRRRKFLELVVLPLGVCLALVMLLRRGFLN